MSVYRIYATITKVQHVVSKDGSGEFIVFTLKSTEPCYTELVRYYQCVAGDGMFERLGDFRRDGKRRVWQIFLTSESDTIIGIENSGSYGVTCLPRIQCVVQ